MPRAACRLSLRTPFELSGPRPLLTYIMQGTSIHKVNHPLRLVPQKKPPFFFLKKKSLGSACACEAFLLPLLKISTTFSSDRAFQRFTGPHSTETRKLHIPSIFREYCPGCSVLSLHYSWNPSARPICGDEIGKWE